MTNVLHFSLFIEVHAAKRVNIINLGHIHILKTKMTCYLGFVFPEKKINGM